MKAIKFDMAVLQKMMDEKHSIIVGDGVFGINELGGMKEPLCSWFIRDFTDHIDMVVPKPIFDLLLASGVSFG